MHTSVWVLVAVLAMAGVVYALARQVRKSLAAGRVVEIGEMMSRHGLDMKTVVDRGLEEDLVGRARACLKCEHYETCANRLRGGGTPDYCDICPNAAFLDGLKERQA